MTLRRKYPSFAQECLMTFLHFLFNFCFPKRKKRFCFFPLPFPRCGESHAGAATDQIRSCLPFMTILFA